MSDLTILLFWRKLGISYLNHTYCIMFCIYSKFRKDIINQLSHKIALGCRIVTLHWPTSWRKINAFQTIPMWNELWIYIARYFHLQTSFNHYKNESNGIFFQFQSIEINCESGGVIAGAIANGGICPITGEKVWCNPFLLQGGA